MTIDLGRFGVWLQAHKWGPELAVELDKLGYGAIWVGSSPSGDLRDIESLLLATDRIAVATSIVNIWKDDPKTVAKSFHRVTSRYPDRFLLGVGAGHPEQTKQYASPYGTLVDYLDALDEGGVPVDRRVLAALGPKVLRLARDRTAGALPYLTTPAHTEQAREILGPDALLAPEQKVVLETDPDRARAIARPRIQNPYLGLVNYTNNLRRFGFTDEDLAGGGSDSLIDALGLHGTAETVVAGLTAHLDAGADHVAVQLLAKDPADLIPGFRALAEAMPR